MGARRRLWRPFEAQGVKARVLGEVEPKLEGLHQSILRVCGRIVNFSYVFLLYVVGEEDPIGFSWILYWYLPHIADIVAGGCQCCPILCL